ncbi:hypothetical protein [Oceanobacillus senegalensis]|uniref:hypothetical protein n=1 Tax=Oceanobacillus senegalensis TaxID=1936063 RepID=UPI0015C4CC51|nr:hypothetical protein [Oceanobacillus senegalensis]
MNDAMIGFCFLLCLLVGIGIGVIFQAIEVGGAIGLGIGLLVVSLFRKKDNKI